MRSDKQDPHRPGARNGIELAKNGHTTKFKRSTQRLLQEGSMKPVGTRRLRRSLSPLILPETTPDRIPGTAGMKSIGRGREATSSTE